MIRLTRFQFTIALFALLFLRLTIGFHFFKEGVTKRDQGTFDAEGFLASAKGPLAPLYQKMIEDNDHAYLLCYDKEKEEVDPELTIFIWEDYKNKVAAQYQFGSPEKVEALKQKRLSDRIEIERLRKEIADLQRPPVDDDSDTNQSADDSVEDSDLKSNDDDDRTDDPVTRDTRRPVHFFTSSQAVEKDGNGQNAENEEKRPAEQDDSADSATDSAGKNDEDQISNDKTTDDTNDDDSDPASSDEDSTDKKSKEAFIKTVPAGLEAKQRRLDELIARYEQAERDILKIRRQREEANQIFEQHVNSLKLYLAENKTEIENYFRGLDRWEGFSTDGEGRTEVAQEVPTLNYQLNQIKSEMRGKAAPWISTLRTQWDDYEAEINELALKEDREKLTISLTRPHDKGPILNFVNQAIPWFDITVGVLLFFGLFTRFAALAGALFLASVISTQLPWVPNAEPTYYQFVEMAGLLVLAATAAGRFGGLDYFINAIFWSRETDDQD